MRLLIASPSPRDIDPWLRSWDALTKWDRYIVKYYNEQEAYEEIQRYFLAHLEYTHLAILPDDLLVTSEQIDKLLSADLPVISGICLINRGKAWENQLAVSVWLEPQSIIRGERTYHFMTVSEYNALEKKIIPVTFQGFAPMIARRDVIERVKFRDDREPNNLERGCCVDLMFCNDCIELGISLHADLSVFTDHYLYLGHKKGARVLNFGTGRFPPYTKLILSLSGAAV